MADMDLFRRLLSYVIFLNLLLSPGDYAFIAEKSWYQAELPGDCNLAMMKETFYPTNYGMAFQEKTPYLKLFSDR